MIQEKARGVIEGQRKHGQEGKRGVGIHWGMAKEA